MSQPEFLPGVPVDYVLRRFALAGGNEVESGKLASPESSAALAANSFAWFAHRPHLLPPFPGVTANYPAVSVDIEACVRLPWSGGRHPWLDALITTPHDVIGVESKRYEPFRGAKKVSLSTAYDRPVWGKSMSGFQQMRDELRLGRTTFRHLDATQLVKHALGLRTEGERTEKRPVLVYLFAEPPELAGKPIPATIHAAHRTEIAAFANCVRNDVVQFCALSYADWTSTWEGRPEVNTHGRRLAQNFMFGPDSTQGTNRKGMA